MKRTRVGQVLLAALLLLAPMLATAQSAGRISGTVVDEAGQPVGSARVTVVGTRFGALTDAAGTFSIAGVTPGTYQLRVSRPGVNAGAAQNVTVRAGEEARVALQVTSVATQLDELVISASRRTERITEAPATITRIPTSTIENSVGNSFAGALKEVQGLDFIQTGVTSVAINARGFNSSFNNRMLMMEDGRISVLPENGLPVGQFTATPKVDLAGIEVLVGPGSALYGADASSGVISLQTKDPRAYPGTTVEVTGGNRNYRDLQARHAGVLGSWGYKVAGEYMEANDFENRLTLLPGNRAKPFEPGDTAIAGAMPEVGPGGALGLDWHTSVKRGSAALVYYMGENQFKVSGGASETDGVGQTNVGRNQLRDWTYNFLQAQYTTPRVYLNLYRAQSQSGSSFANNRFTLGYYPNLRAAADKKLTDDQLVLASDWPSDGRMYAAEAQTNFSAPMLFGTDFVLGGQYRRDVVSSDRQWLTDRLTGEDVAINQFGVYGQTETPLGRSFELILAARFDSHENYDPQFSPKAGLVFKPAPGQALRVTYNRAFKSPTILQTNFFIPDWNAVTAIFGNTEGYTILDAAGDTVTTYSPLVPEENRTWEVGYKGVLGNRLFVDVAGYYSQYENFLSPLAIISDPLGLGLAGRPRGEKTFAFGANGELITNAAGSAPLTLIYYNLGEATLYGTDAGVNFILTPKVNLKGTVSLTKLEDVEVEAGREEATALNSPEVKWTLGANFTDIQRFLGSATVRHADDYYFRSGLNRGVVPAFTTLDVNLGYRIPRVNTLLSVGVSNLFTCGGEYTYNYGTDPQTKALIDPNLQNPVSRNRECGFGVKHQEMINMPFIGTMVFIGAQFQTP